MSWRVLQPPCLGDKCICKKIQKSWKMDLYSHSLETSNWTICNFWTTEWPFTNLTFYIALVRLFWVQEESFAAGIKKSELALNETKCRIWPLTKALWQIRLWLQWHDDTCNIFMGIARYRRTRLSLGWDSIKCRQEIHSQQRWAQPVDYKMRVARTADEKKNGQILK